jgi:hypothetical protein
MVVFQNRRWRKGNFMEFLDMLLGGGKNRRRRDNDGFSGILGRFSKWILGCSCLLVGAFVGAIILLLAGIVSFGQDAMTVIIVIAMIIVALASLIRTSMGY